MFEERTNRIASTSLTGERIGWGVVISCPRFERQRIQASRDAQQSMRGRRHAPEADVLSWNWFRLLSPFLLLRLLLFLVLFLVMLPAAADKTWGIPPAMGLAMTAAASSKQVSLAQRRRIGGCRYKMGREPVS
ncbi:hypothetical protein F5X97DRAFT_22929 [Nemania serpens]|nr:hypothetical protein F5X97DRAFT_22929 [Nemania serpens]